MLLLLRCGWTSPLNSLPHAVWDSMNISWFSPDHWAVKSEQFAHHGLFGHSQREKKMFTINANKFILLGNVCAVDCNNCVKAAATAPNCIFLCCPGHKLCKRKWCTLDLNYAPIGARCPDLKHSVARNLRAVKTLSSFLKLIPCQRALSTEKRFEIRSSTLVIIIMGQKISSASKGLLSPHSFVSQCPLTAPQQHILTPWTSITG